MMQHSWNPCLHPNTSRPPRYYFYNQLLTRQQQSQQQQQWQQQQQQQLQCMQNRTPCKHGPSRRHPALTSLHCSLHSGIPINIKASHCQTSGASPKQTMNRVFLKEQAFPARKLKCYCWRLVICRCHPLTCAHRRGSGRLGASGGNPSAASLVHLQCMPPPSTPKPLGIGNTRPLQTQSSQARFQRIRVYNTRYGKKYAEYMAANLAKQAGHFREPESTMLLDSAGGFLENFIDRQMSQSTLTSESNLNKRREVKRTHDTTPSWQSTQLKEGAVMPWTFRKGLEVLPPNLLSDSPSVHLPPLPPAMQGLRLRLFIFWDIDDKHPDTLDPRVLVHRLRGVLAHYGRVVELNAYAIRKAFNWVPTYFIRTYSPSGETAAERSRAGSQKGEMQQGVKCATCGAVLDNDVALKEHIRQMHGSSRGSTNGGSSSGITNGSSTSRGSSARLAAGAAGRVSDVRNMYNSTIGLVRAYYNSLGTRLEPPIGHQLSLKYVLLQESVDVRIVQKANEAAHESLASAVLRLAAEAAESEDGESAIVAVILSDLAISKQLTKRCHDAGMFMFHVSSSRSQLENVDLNLSWQLLRDGKYISKKGK